MWCELVSSRYIFWKKCFSWHPASRICLGQPIRLNTTKNNNVMWAREHALHLFEKKVFLCWNHRNVAPVHVSLGCIHSPCPTSLMRTTECRWVSECLWVVRVKLVGHGEWMHRSDTGTGATYLWFQHPKTFFQKNVTRAHELTSHVFEKQVVFSRIGCPKQILEVGCAICCFFKNM